MFLCCLLVFFGSVLDLFASSYLTPVFFFFFFLDRCLPDLLVSSALYFIYLFFDAFALDFSAYNPQKYRETKKKKKHFLTILEQETEHFSLFSLKVFCVNKSKINNKKVC